MRALESCKDLGMRPSSPQLQHHFNRPSNGPRLYLYTIGQGIPMMPFSEHAQEEGLKFLMGYVCHTCGVMLPKAVSRKMLTTHFIAPEAVCHTITNASYAAKCRDLFGVT